MQEFGDHDFDWSAYDSPVDRLKFRDDLVEARALAKADNWVEARAKLKPWFDMSEKSDLSAGNHMPNLGEFPMSHGIVGDSYQLLFYVDHDWEDEWAITFMEDAINGIDWDGKPSNME